MARGKTATETADKAAGIGDDYKSPISPEESKTPPPPEGGPGSPMEIIFSFDTTGSMYSALAEVRNNVSDLIRRLQGDIPNIRIGVIAHGDYCDESTYYVIKMADFTRDTDKLVNFVNGVGETGGGDSDECYELALKTARTQFTWTAGTQRSLVVIGDAHPHKTDYYFYKDHTPIDWKKEAKSLANMGVHIYGVSCKGGAQDFYQTMAKMTDGTYLQLKDFKNIFDMICAICYREHGAEYYSAFEKEVRDREARMISKDLDSMLVTLRKSESNASTVALKDSTPSSTLKASLKRAAPTTSSSTSSKRSRSSSPKKVSKPKSVKFVKPKTAKAPVKVAKSTKITAVGKSTKTAFPGRVPRENAKVREVTVKNSTWSRWVDLLNGDKTGSTTRPRLHGYGFRNPSAFVAEEQSPAVYEVAVCLPRSVKRHVVLVRRMTVHRGCLDTSLFTARQNEQMDDLLKKGCKVSVRRAVVSGKGSPKQVQQRLRRVTRELRMKFDYAWCKNAYGRSKQRSLTKRSIVISSSDY